MLQYFRFARLVHARDRRERGQRGHRVREMRTGGGHVLIGDAEDQLARLPVDGAQHGELFTF